MCEMLKSTPLDSETPIDRSDLFFETQMVFLLYDKLPAKWEGYSGQYLGKDLILLPILLKEFKIDKSIRQYAWELIPIIDNYVAQDVAQKLKNKSKSKGGPT